MCVYNQMCMIFIHLLLCKHERNYLGDSYFLHESILRKVILEELLLCWTCMFASVCVAVWLYIISEVKWADSLLEIQTEFVIQSLTSRLKEHRSPEEMVKLWPKTELKHHREESVFISLTNSSLRNFIHIPFSKLVVLPCGLFQFFLCHSPPRKRNTSLVKKYPIFFFYN